MPHRQRLAAAGRSEREAADGPEAAAAAVVSGGGVPRAPAPCGRRRRPAARCAPPRVDDAEKIREDFAHRVAREAVQGFDDEHGAGLDLAGFDQCEEGAEPFYCFLRSVLSVSVCHLGDHEYAREFLNRPLAELPNLYEIDIPIPRKLI